jgi:prolyl oligopeptidase
MTAWMNGRPAAMPTHRRYPGAPRQDVVQELHGQRVPDPYRWLEDAGDPRTLRWTAEQDAAYQEARASWPGADSWNREITKLGDVGRGLAPQVHGSRVFQLRHGGGDREHPVLWVREDGTERPLLDPAVLDPSGRTVLDAWKPSHEGNLVAYQVSRDGTEDSRLWVLDVATGQTADGPIDRVRSTSVGWLPGGEMFYYVGRLAPGTHPGEDRYHRRVYLHKVGSDRDADVMVFGDGRDKTQFYSVAVTADGRWLTITATTGTAPGTDLYLADLSAGPPDRPELLAVQEGARARTLLHIAPGAGPQDELWLRTDSNAERGRVAACRPAGLAAGGWRDLIAERPDAVLTDFAVLTGAELARPVGLVAWTRHAAAEITVHDLADGRQTATVPLPGTGTVSGISVRPEGGHDAWFAYTDYATPLRVLHYDGRTGQVRPWAQSGEVPDDGGVSVCQQAFQSRDGTTVRMFVISPTGRPDRPRPAILNGYGGFGASLTPKFSPHILAWARAGGVWAVACLRGGREEGEEWHRGGRGALKQNVFDDFDAAADHLTAAGWTSRDQLGVIGGSAGGLLVGAAITQHPEKYAAAVCMSPLLDMVRYERSGLGPSWVPEFGTAHDPAQLRTLLSYSPYHHVAPGTAYPAALFTVSDGDTRVDPMHARKMCAALQYASTGDGPVLLRFERGAGHGSRASSRLVGLQADGLAFLACHLGLPAPEGTP